MSLNADERTQTSAELKENAERSRLPARVIQRALGFSEARLDAALHVSPSCDPVDVWVLRDFLDEAVVHTGGQPEPYSVLTEDARAAAQRWHDLREPPPVPSADSPA
jgi:hypothetical protein